MRPRRAGRYEMIRISATIALRKRQLTLLQNDDGSSIQYILRALRQPDLTTDIHKRISD